MLPFLQGVLDNTSEKVGGGGFKREGGKGEGRREGGGEAVCDGKWKRENNNTF